MPIKYFVYLLIFPHGKIYVGMSKTDAKGLYTNRYRNHEAAARRGNPLPLYNAWRKHGAPEMVVSSEHPTRDECALAEIGTIAFLETTKPETGYNLMHGGEGLNAPKGSPMHALMTERVWQNPERIAKLSKALKGRAPAEATQEAFRQWLETGGRQIKAANSREQFASPEARRVLSERTKAQMTPEARAHISVTLTGRSDPRSPEGKERQRAKIKAYLATPEGKASAQRGQAAARSNPETVAKMNAGLASWRSSEANAEHCKRIADASAKACSRAVRDNDTGIEYPSQRAMAKAIGVSDAIITHRVKSGRATRLAQTEPEA